MDGDLDRSVRLLDDAVSAQGRKLFRQTCKASNDSTFFTAEEFDNNCTYSIRDDTLGQPTFCNTTVFGKTVCVDPSKQPSGENLFMEFFEILQTHLQMNEVLNGVAEMSQCCDNTLAIRREANEKFINKQQDDTWLENERNTWRLLHILYTNRLSSSTINSEENDLETYMGYSEKCCMESLFKRNHLLRECQLIVDWLEFNAAQKSEDMMHFSDCSVGWENTLHQLKSKETIVFKASHKIVSHMDPDAPHYEKLPLHDTDMDDEKKLNYQVFHLIRAGKLEEAQKLCGQCGHFWRAAQMEGWKLFHNGNLEATATDENEVILEGNETRDLWKEAAWMYTNMDTLDKYEKASIAIFCGHLKPVVNVCKTWEDYLWAYLRVMIDIRVESDLRECVMKTYHDMPKPYWEQKMTINELFTALEACKEKRIHREALTPDHIIQKYIILDEINNLVEAIADWILDEDISTQFLRFLTHLLMFLEQIDQVNNRDIIEKVIEEYLKHLMQKRQTQLVAFYASKLNEATQIHIYSSYLESITDNDERKEALLFAEDCDMNVAAITKQVVESIRGRHDRSNEIHPTMGLSVSDEFKINSLDWLLFDVSQRAELLIQANALMSQYLIMDKPDAALLAINKIPADSIQLLTKEEPIPDSVQQMIREHLSYKAYFEAQESVNVWFKNNYNKPRTPECPPEGAPYAKKVEYEHRLSQYNAELGRWKITIDQLIKSAKTALYNMLLFPDGGWLHGAKEAKYLQTKYIPKCVLLLFRVLYDAGQYEECLQLADIIASEKTQLYKHYTSKAIGELLGRLADASIALLDQKKDPWGNDTRA